MAEKPVEELTDEELQQELTAFGLAQQPNPGAQFGINPTTANLIQNTQAILQNVQGASGRDVLTAGEFGIRSFLDNLLNIPQGTGEALAFAAGGAQTLAETPFKEEAFGERLGQNVEAQRGLFPASALINAPRVDTGDIAALDEALSPRPGESVGESFQRARQIQSIRDQATRAVNPIATGVGDVAGDVATLALGRKLTGRTAASTAAKPLQASVKTKFDGMAGRILKNLDLGSKKFARGLGRATEVGLEAATLEFLESDPDPIKMFAYGAGVQGAGSVGLNLLEKPLSRGVLLVGGTAWLTHEMLKAAGPGEQDFFGSKDFAVQTMVGAFTLGALGALTGAGRLRGPAAERAPVFFDTLTQAPRTATRALFTDLLDAKNNNAIEWRVLEKMATNPTFFNENQMNSLGRAMANEKEGSFAREVQRLIQESPDFREKVDDL